MGISPRLKKGLLMCALGVQHLFATLGGIVVVPIILGMSTSMALFASGLGTVLFYFAAKRQVPVFHGSSFTYMSGLTAFLAYTQRKQLSQEAYIARQAVAIIIGGIFFFIYATIVYFIGPTRINKLFPPIVVGPIVISIGLSLCPSIISSNIVAHYSGDSAEFKGYEVWVAVVVVCLVIIGVTCFAPGIWNVFGIVFGIVAGYIVSAAMQVIDYTKITDASWIIFEPDAFMDTFGFYKEMAWDWNAIVMIVPLTIVGFMEHLGDIKTNSAVCRKDFIMEPGLHRTIFGDGLAMVAAGFTGAPPMATYSQNTGVLVITRNFNPDVLAIAGGYAMFLGLITKIGGVFSSIPDFVIGGASMMMFGIIACMGIKVLVDNHVDVAQSRNLIILAIIIIIAVGFDTGGVVLQAGDVEISTLAVAVIVGCILNLVFPEKLSQDKNQGNDEQDTDEKIEEANEQQFQESSSESSSSTSSTTTTNSTSHDTVQEIKGAIEP